MLPPLRQDLDSRVAKNFQDYFINVITQRLGDDAVDAAEIGRASCRERVYSNV